MPALMLLGSGSAAEVKSRRWVEISDGLLRITDAGCLSRLIKPQRTTVKEGLADPSEVCPRPGCEVAYRYVLGWRGIAMSPWVMIPATFMVRVRAGRLWQTPPRLAL
jgi:hypothetical protein